MDALQNVLFNCLIAGYVFAHLLFVGGLIYTVAQDRGEEQDNATKATAAEGNKTQ